MLKPLCTNDPLPILFLHLTLLFYTYHPRSRSPGEVCGKESPIRKMKGLKWFPWGDFSPWTHHFSLFVKMGLGVREYNFLFNHKLWIAIFLPAPKLTTEKLITHTPFLPVRVVEGISVQRELPHCSFPPTFPHGRRKLRWGKASEMRARKTKARCAEKADCKIFFFFLLTQITGIS